MTVSTPDTRRVFRAGPGDERELVCAIQAAHARGEISDIEAVGMAMSVWAEMDQRRTSLLRGWLKMVGFAVGTYMAIAGMCWVIWRMS
jgi:hypothetical protein